MDGKTPNTWIKTHHHRLLFIMVIVFIYWATYFAYASMGNVVQDYAIRHNLDPKLYPWLTIIAARISLVATALCMLGSLQAINRQRWILIGLLAALVIFLCIPFTVHLYPFISGLESIISTLIKPWLQLYIPPALRATISGVSMGLTGVFDITSANMEDSWMEHLSRYRYLAIIFVVLLIFFWQLSHQSNRNKHSPTLHQAPKSILFLLTQHPYIFIAFFFSGVNCCIFDYTFILAKEVLPNASAEHYQYALYLGSIFLPIVLGILADKKSIFMVMLGSAILLIAINFITAFCFKFSITSSGVYLILAFIEGGLAISATTLSASLIGERLKTQGIFRSFAMSGILFDIGSLFAGRIYEFCANSFFTTKIGIGFMNIILVTMLWKYYQKDRVAPSPI